MDGRAGIPSIVVALAIAGGIGCRSERPLQHVEMPIVRFTEERPPSVPGVRHGADLEIDRDRRRTLASVETVSARATVVAKGNERILRLDVVPPSVRAARTVVVQRKTRLRGNPATVATLTTIEPSGGLSVRFDRQDEPPNGTIVLRSTAPPEAYDVLTAELTVPAGAVLRFAVGVDAPGTQAVGIVMPRVEVVDSSGTQLLWQKSRPVTKRAWDEHVMSLERWAGRTIRLRFAAAPVPASSRARFRCSPTRWCSPLAPSLHAP